MIWLKRLLPLVILLVAWFGWKGITKSQQEKATASDSRYALVTAHAWVAATSYRENESLYLAYRDSLLQANNITKDELFQHLELFEQDLNRQLAFSQTVSHLVDSLLKANPASLSSRAASDTVRQDSVLSDSAETETATISRMPVPRPDSSKR